MVSSSLNNSSISESMDLDAVLRAADARVRQMNADATTSTGALRVRNEETLRQLIDAARSALPKSVAPFVVDTYETNRDDFPTGVSVAIDLPGSERIHFGPWAYDEASQTFDILPAWKNKPFEVAGGNREEFGDLLDAIARAREIYRARYVEVYRRRSSP